MLQAGDDALAELGAAAVKQESERAYITVPDGAAMPADAQSIKGLSYTQAFAIYKVPLLMTRCWQKKLGAAAAQVMCDHFGGMAACPRGIGCRSCYPAPPAQGYVQALRTLLRDLDGESEVASCQSPLQRINELVRDLVSSRLATCCPAVRPLRCAACMRVHGVSASWPADSPFPPACRPSSPPGCRRPAQCRSGSCTTSRSVVLRPAAPSPLSARSWCVPKGGALRAPRHACAADCPARPNAYLHGCLVWCGDTLSCACRRRSSTSATSSARSWRRRSSATGARSARSPTSAAPLTPRSSAPPRPARTA